MDNFLDQHRGMSRWNNNIAFLKGFLKHPEQVGSVIPSSRYLERCLAETVLLQQAKNVVELGPGTGGTTQAILDVLPEQAKFLAIELNPEFVKLLKSNADPRLIVHQGSAEHINQILDLYDIDRPDVVVSGIPFSTMPNELARRILHNVWTCLVPDGYFIAYQFRDRVAELGREFFGKPDTRLEIFNVPPVRIYKWRKQKQAV